MRPEKKAIRSRMESLGLFRAINLRNPIRLCDILV